MNSGHYIKYNGCDGTGIHLVLRILGLYAMWVRTPPSVNVGNIFFILITDPYPLFHSRLARV